MPNDHYDFFVIGAGSGGVRAARMAAGHGIRVAVAEESRLGGTCVNVGCVPKKLLVYAAHFRDEFEDSLGFGWTVSEPSFDWATLIEHKDREIHRLNEIYRRLLGDAGVDILDGRATLLDRHTVRIGEQSFSADTILIATGGRPHRLDIPGADLAIVSDDAFYLRELPERVVIVGGGYIAVEFAGIFEGLGSHVDLVYRGELFLRGFDDDLRSGLAEQMTQRGVRLRFNRQVTEIEAPTEEGRRVALDNGSTLESDLVLFAVGRNPNTTGLGLEQAGVELDDDGAVCVDEYSRTTLDNIYSVGDCTNRMPLTPVAIAEAMAMVETAFANRPVAMDYRNVPSAIFSQPPIATVGLGESEARERFGEVDVYRSSFRPMKGTLSGRSEETTIKLVVDPESDRVLGAHMIGSDAPEIIQGVAIALQCKATKAQFDATIGIHPTSAEEFVALRDE